MRKKRIHSGGNRKKIFVEAWVEFRDKVDAKRVASVLNNSPIGGKKRDRYHDDLWNVKYLSKFKWHHLKEKLGLYRNDWN